MKLLINKVEVKVFKIDFIQSNEDLAVFRLEHKCIFEHGAFINELSTGVSFIGMATEKGLYELIHILSKSIEFNYTDLTPKFLDLTIDIERHFAKYRIPLPDGSLNRSDRFLSLSDSLIYAYYLQGIPEHLIRAKIARGEALNVFEEMTLESIAKGIFPPVINEIEIDE